MSMLESADSFNNMKPVQSMFASSANAAGSTPPATSSGAFPASPAATLTYLSGESFDSVTESNDSLSNYTPPASRGGSLQVPDLMPQPAMVTFGSGPSTGSFRQNSKSQETLSQESTPVEPAEQKRDTKKKRQSAQTMAVSASSSSSTTAKSLFTARSMSIKDLKLDSCIDASIESTGITLDDIAAYVKEPDAKDRSIDGGKKWTCIYPGCGKKFGRKENIKSHIQTHLGDRQFKCNHCNKCFVRVHDLKRHAKIHTGLKPYPCECGNSFARHDALTRHKQRGMCSGAIRPPAPRTVKRGRPRTRNLGAGPSSISRPTLTERMGKAQMAREKIQMQHEQPNIARNNGNINGNGYSSASEMSSAASTVSSSSVASPTTAENFVYHGQNMSGQMSRIDEEQQRYIQRDGVGLPPGVFTFTPPTTPGSAYDDIYNIDKNMDGVLPQWTLPENGTQFHDAEKMTMSHSLLSAHQFPPSPANATSSETHTPNMFNSTQLVHNTPSVAPSFDDGFTRGIKFMPTAFDTAVSAPTTNFGSSFASPEMVGATTTTGELDYQPSLFLQDDISSGNDGTLFSDDRYSSFSGVSIHNVLMDDGLMPDNMAV